MSFSIDGMRSFVELAQELHFGRAAKRLHMSQPTLTKQIQRLESDLGTRLFVRTTGRVSLTPGGEALREKAAALVAAAADLESFARAAGRGEIGTLRIGFGIAALSDLLPRAVIAYRKAFPRARLEMQDMGSRPQLNALLEGAIDVGFVRVPIRQAQIASVVVLREEMLIAVSTSRGSSEALSLADLRDDPFVLIDRTTSATLHHHALALCAQAGFQPNVVQEVKEMFTVLNLVRAGMGVSLVPAAAQRMRVPGVQFHAISEAEARWKIAMAWRRDRAAVVQPFVRLVTGLSRKRSV